MSKKCENCYWWMLSPNGTDAGLCRHWKTGWTVTAATGRATKRDILTAHDDICGEWEPAPQYEGDDMKEGL